MRTLRSPAESDSAVEAAWPTGRTTDRVTNSAMSMLSITSMAPATTMTRIM